MNNLLSYIVALGVASACAAAVAQEQPKVSSSAGGLKVITGEVAYANPDANVGNHQTEALTSLDEWAGKLQTIVTSSGSGRAPDLNQNAVSYLSVLYFYCTVKQGPCPFILETVLDADIALSRAEDSITCALTNRFFKSYLSQELDERGKYLFSLTRGLEVDKFNTTERSRFVECKETVSATIADKEVLAQRFGGKGTEATSVAAFRSLLAEIKDQKVDIFVATGVSGKDAPVAQP